jgi:hypothetical protein
MRVSASSTGRRLVGAVAGALTILAASVPTAHAAKPVTGKLSQAGATVIALDAGGEAASAATRANGKFKLRPSAKKVSLHLRAADGTYAGPVVIDKRGKRGKKAILGVEAGANLGKVKVRNGYAKLKRDLPGEDVDRKRKAKAKRGVPIGAGNFGRVVAAATGASGPGQDLDRDGIPGALDVDDDGDLVLDDLDPASAPHAAGASRRGPALPSEIFDLTSLLPLRLDTTANANTPGATDAQIESALPSFGRLAIEVLAGDSPELDCAGDPGAQPPRPGLVYCSSGGSGRLFQPGVPFESWPSFPGPAGGEFDPDADGFGTLTGQPPPPGGTTSFMTLAHGATTTQIGTGDLMIGRVVRDGEEAQFPATLRYAFATVPALASYADTAGNSFDVPYPVAPGGPGTQDNGFPVATGLGGDVAVTLSFWRPQRRPIAEEACLAAAPPCDWVDIGGLTYSAVVGHIGPPGSPPGGTEVNQPCGAAAFSSSDEQIGPPPSTNPGGLFTDLATDGPANPSDTLTYTLNLTDCVTSAGASWGTDDHLDVGFEAIAAQQGAIQGGASQSVRFRCVDAGGCAP